MKIRDNINDFLDNHGDFSGFSISVVTKDGVVSVQNQCTMFELSLMVATSNAVLSKLLLPKEGMVPQPEKSNVQSIKKP